MNVNYIAFGIELEDSKKEEESYTEGEDCKGRKG